MGKPTTPFGQLPLLQWGDEVICQSMACARFVAREVGLAGNTSMESAQVDEIIDVIQHLLDSWRPSWLVVVDSSLWETTSPGLTSIPSCISVISLTKVSSKVSPSLQTLLRELEIFQTSRTGWRPDLSPPCKLQYQPHTFITFTIKQSVQKKKKKKKTRKKKKKKKKKKK